MSESASSFPHPVYAGHILRPAFEDASRLLFAPMLGRWAMVVLAFSARLAQLAIQRPQIALLDEPLTHLDPAHQTDLADRDRGGSRDARELAVEVGVVDLVLRLQQPPPGRGRVRPKLGGTAACARLDVGVTLLGGVVHRRLGPGLGRAEHARQGVGVAGDVGDDMGPAPPG